ncbi:MAG: 3-isopropylmalate dehydratase small subunit [Candidatus Omnitrophota bacterium]|nr:MAG: 3-isopropylmalate dehydratase small subunit [Candidatus Omnitrophota bacterium]RKY34186.1 MAG: 3-isopropylmalate dehydratase small subunit [Candidatus Omnitrophota bacterium]RKY43844.1 MAG: 3-isopropylmalate dehydratase small subunit [Candidatus Omnitrophota bacterium]
MIIRGRAHKFGDNINTDDIIAAKYLDSQDEKFLGSKCMENIYPNFSKQVKKGDIIIAGKNFGCGSSREHAPLAIKGCGISLVIAKSFARIFYRNSINIGLPLLECKEVDSIKDKDFLEVDLSKGEIKIVGRSKVLNSEKFPLFLQEIINREGLIAWLRCNLKERRNR